MGDGARDACGPAARLGSPAAPHGGAGPVDSGRPLTGGLLDPSAGSETAPIPAQIGPKMADLVPHTGIAANVRRVPAEYGCYGGLRPAPVGPDGLEGTNEGTEAASTKRITAATRTADFVLRSLSLGPSESHRESHAIWPRRRPRARCKPSSFRGTLLAAPGCSRRHAMSTCLSAHELFRRRAGAQAT
jgi:hypothetical protein